MTDKIIVRKYNDVYIHLDCERGVLYEIAQYFTFQVPGYQFMPSFQDGMWDGKIRLVNLNTQLLYAGLLSYVEKFCRDRDYEVVIHDSIQQAEQFSVEEAKDFVLSLDLPMVPHEHQMKAFVTAVRNRRRLILSPTASGKSLIIYLLVRFYEEKSLIVVPTIQLVHQMYGDFKEYSNGTWGPDECHLITGGKEKTSDKPVLISTWQSIYKQRKNYFDPFRLVIGDEAHGFKATSLTSIMTKLINTPYRVGLTGTLDETETHQLVLEGLFGPVKKVISTAELMEKDLLSQFEIKCIVLKHKTEDAKALRKKKYHEEIDYLISHDKRNKFIRNLAVSLEGNTIVLFRMVEKHGKVLYDLIKEKVDGKRKVFYVHGGTDAEAREEVRRIVERETDAIIVSSSVFSTGTNIVNLHNAIFASPSKGRIRNLQSIGRILRKTKDGNQATLYDIADDLIIGQHKNFTIKHFAARVKIYNEEKFNYTLYRVKI